MSSPKADADPRLPVPEYLRGPRSITGRLTWLYVGSTALLLTLAASFLYWGLKDSRRRTDRALVAGKLSVIQTLLQDHYAQPDMIRGEVEHEAAANRIHRYYIRVLDAQGRVLYETDGMSRMLPVLAFPARGESGQPPVQTVERRLPDGENYLLMSGEAIEGPGRSHVRVVQVALNMHETSEIVARYRWRLATMLTFGTCFAAIAGVIVTRVGLRSLRDITLATRKVTASKLDARLVAEHWPEELRQLAGEFDAMLDRLQDSFARLTGFSSDLAHAMRNPINNLRGETEVALTRARSPEEYRQTLASSLEEYERLSRLIEGMLFIARADDPQAALERVAFPARAEMEAVRDFYEAFAAERRVTVDCHGDALLTGDPQLVRRAVSNLLGNALKHTPAGGRVELTARTLEDGTVEIAAADTGVGIAPEHLPKVFERFFQADKTRQGPGGAGLGLAIVRSIMRLHGGEASVSSTVGVGTTFTLRFPALSVSKL